MSETPTLTTTLYTDSAGRAVSVQDLLDYFHSRGTLRVSDLHLKTGCPPVYRIDGELSRMDGPPLEAETVRRMASALVSGAELDTLASEGAVDSSLLTETLQFRINCFRENDGLAVAVRALEPKPIDVEQIGFPNNIWQDIVTRQWGLVLVTGITGAGKSTTIASLIDRIVHTRPLRIITLEEPIEYRLASAKGLVSQREVGRDVPSFAHGLRDCLREDPDVIFVGEMRDRESATWTLTAAETGHLVFSSLHTRDARGTITRILDMFPVGRQDEVANQLSLGLGCIVSQKLVPRADGKGRVAAMEVLNNTYAMANHIRLRKVEQVYSHLQTRTRDIPTERMTTLERSLAGLVSAGKVTAQEGGNWANDINAYAQEIRHLGRRK